MIKILTPPLPLPYKGGEWLPPCPPQGLREALPYKGGEWLPPYPPQGLREALPSLVGEGQGWGQYLSLPSLQGERLRERQRVGASAGMGERSSGMGQGWGQYFNLTKLFFNGY